MHTHATQKHVEAPAQDDIVEQANEEKVKLLQAAEARIKARVGRLVGSYSEAAER